MPPHDDPFDDLVIHSRAQVHQYTLWLDQLRAGDHTFAEASALYPGDMNEWQSAVYLLTGCQQVWSTVRDDVLGEVTIAPVMAELDDTRRSWSCNERAVMRWAVHFWDVYSTHVGLPYVFEPFLFARWITACHLYKRIAPALIMAGGRR